MLSEILNVKNKGQVIRENVVNAILSNKPVLLKGAPGVGKTYLLEQVAKKLNAKFYYFLCHSWLTEEDFLAKFDPIKGRWVDGLLPTIIKESHKRKVFLLIDELDKTREAVDNLFLDFLQNMRAVDVDGNLVYGNEKNIYVGFTTNELREISEPLLRRLQVFTLPWLPLQVELNIIKDKILKYIPILEEAKEGMFNKMVFDLWLMLYIVRKGTGGTKGDIKSLTDLIEVIISRGGDEDNIKMLIISFFESKFEVYDIPPQIKYSNDKTYETKDYFDKIVKVLFLLHIIFIYYKAIQLDYAIEIDENNLTEIIQLLDNIDNANTNVYETIVNKFKGIKNIVAIQEKIEQEINNSNENKKDKKQEQEQEQEQTNNIITEDELFL